MADPTIEFNHVYKKFARGEQHTALRDFIPAMAKRLWPFGKKPEEAVALKGQEFWAVNDVSFKLMRGESMGIIGPNGSGKSTTLKLLSGILRPESGTYKVRGRLSALIEVGAGFHPDLTGRENVYLNGCILGMTRKEVAAKFNQIVEFAGVEEFIDTPVKRYSSGMTVRLGFAISAFIDPEVLLVDEVLAVGDTEFRNRCGARMNKMLSNGVTMILVSHNLNEVRNLCKSCLMLYRGRCEMQGETHKVIEAYHKIVGEKIKQEQEKQLLAETSDRPKTALRICAVQTLNQYGGVAEVFQTGDPMTLRIFYEAQDRMERPNFHVELLWSDDDYVAAVFNTKQRNVNLGPIEGRGHVDLKIDSLLTVPMPYSFNVRAVDEQGNVLDSVPKVRFVVNENIPIGGIFGLTHTWTKPVKESQNGERGTPTKEQSPASEISSGVAKGAAA